jgi:sortase (surface protein transpeptidase)
LRRAVLCIAAGVALLTSFGVVACRSTPPPSVGSENVTALASPSPSPPVSRKSSAPAKAGAVTPTGLRIPKLKLTATIIPVGVDDNGDFAVPPSVDRVGWYRYGPGFAADRGSIAIAGHVDSAEQGKGAFFKLGSLSPGDTVVLTDSEGATREFKVVGRERYAKTKIPLDRYFARDGKPRLTLITCGGPFDASTGHYRDNVVVTAVPG